MEHNALVTDLRSITAAALTATSAAERGDWREAIKCVRGVAKCVDQVLRQLEATEQELGGEGDSRLPLRTPKASNQF